MRPNPVVDDEPQDEATYPRVIPINSAGAQPQHGAAQGSHREPWTPRDDQRVVSRRPEPSAPPPQRSRAPARAPQVPPVVATYWPLLASLAIVCAGLLTAALLTRSLSDPGRDPAEAENPQASRTAERGGAVATDPALAPTESPTSGSGAVTTEIRVLQPTYTVAPGDTLASIARRHGTTIEALASINKLENRNALSIGQRLILP